MSSNRRGKRQRSKGCISDNKRTSSCRTGRRNLGTSARRSKARQARGGLDDETMDRDAHDENGRGKDDEVNYGCGEDDEVNNGRDKDDEINDGCGEDDELNNGCGGDDEGKNGCGDGGDSDSDNDDDNAGYNGPCLPNRPKRKFLPSQTQAMALLSMAVPPEDRAAFEDRFRSFKTGIAKPLCPPTGTVCKTRADWIAGAYGCDIALQLSSAADMFPFSGMRSCFLNEIYVMDVILNRAPCSEEPALKAGEIMSISRFFTRASYVFR